MFELVAAVERYPEFVPYWQAVRVRNQSDTSYRTDQVVRFGPLRHTFTTTTRLYRPERIEVISRDPPFRRLSLVWRFETADDGGCRIGLGVDFELTARLLSAIGGLFSRDSVMRMIGAFENRARHIYGAPAHMSHE